MRPHLKLLDRRRAKRIRRANQNLLPITFKPVRQLANRRCLSRAVHAHNHHHRRRLQRPVHRLLAGLKNIQQLLPDQRPQFPCIGQLLPVDALLDPLKNFRRGPHTNIRRDQRILKFLKQIRINFFASVDQIVDRSN